MKKITHVILFVVIIILTNNVSAQEASDKQNSKKGNQNSYVVTGNLAIIKNEKAFNVIVSPRIQKMGVNEDPDTVYISKRVKDMNNKKAGRGDQWLKEWNETKVNLQPAFIEGLNAILSKKGIVCGSDNSSAEYTFVVNTINLYEFMGDIFIGLKLEVVKTKNPTDKIAIIDFPANWGSSKSKKFKGKAENSYYTAGLLFAKYLRKN